MDAKFHKALEDEMEIFVSDVLDSSPEIQEYPLHPELGAQMADAAMAVFEASIRAQEFAKTKD